MLSQEIAWYVIRICACVSLLIYYEVNSIVCNDISNLAEKRKEAKKIVATVYTTRASAYSHTNINYMQKATENS